MGDIGIIFHVDDLGQSYRSEAWQIFMKNLTPENIIGCELGCGEYSEETTTTGYRQRFCIAVLNCQDAIETITTVFENCNAKGLAPPGQRFILNPRDEKLQKVGYIDSLGRLVQDEWKPSFHDYCLQNNWGYMPNTIMGHPYEDAIGESIYPVPQEELTSKIKSELKKMSLNTAHKLEPCFYCLKRAAEDSMAATRKLYLFSGDKETLKKLTWGAEEIPFESKDFKIPRCQLCKNEHNWREKKNSSFLLRTLDSISDTLIGIVFLSVGIISGILINNISGSIIIAILGGIGIGFLAAITILKLLNWILHETPELQAIKCTAFDDEYSLIEKHLKKGWSIFSPDELVKLNRSNWDMATEMFNEELKRLMRIHRGSEKQEENEKQDIVEGTFVGPYISKLAGTEADQAVEELAKIGTPAVEPLIAALENTDLIYHAAEALGKIGDRRAVEPLITVLTGIYEYEHYDSVVRALGEIGDARAVLPLVEAIESTNPNTQFLSDHSDWGMRSTYTKNRFIETAVEALSKIDDPKSIEPLILVFERYKGKYRPFLQEALIHAMSNTGDSRAIDILSAALDEKHLHESASEALEKLEQAD